jgi:poly(A) polymerase
VIYYSLLFSDIVKEALAKEKGHMVPIIKNALEPICKRLEIPKKDKDRLIKTFASQKRFKQINENNVVQNELFKTKDFFYDAFMYFKINAEAENDETGLQCAFFWEISTRIRPKTSTTPNRNNRFEKKKKDKPKFNNKQENHGAKFSKNEEDDEFEDSESEDADGLDIVSEPLEKDGNVGIVEEVTDRSNQSKFIKDDKSPFSKKRSSDPNDLGSFRTKKEKNQREEENLRSQNLRILLEWL